MRTSLRAFATRNIRDKIFLICGFLSVPLIALAVATTIMVRGIATEAEELQHDTIPVIESYESLRVAGLRVIETTNTFALINTFGRSQGQMQNSFSVDKRDELTKARDDFGRALTHLNQRQDDDGGGIERIKRNIEFAHKDILRQSDKILALVAKDAPPSTILSARERFENSALNFRNLIDTAIGAEKMELSELQRALGERMTWTLVTTIGIGIVGILLAFIGGNQLSRRLARPIHLLRDAALLVGNGDFDALRNSPLQARCDRDEISDLVQSFGKMSDRLHRLIQEHGRGERLAMLGQVAATVSHELRNPLAAIRNSIFLIRQSPAGREPANQRAFERVERNIDRCTRIIGDMLEYTRDKVLSRRSVALDRFLAEFLEEYATPGDVPIELDVRDVAVVDIDPGRFRQVLVNLVDNAAQALTDKEWQPQEGHFPRIVLRAETIGEQVALSIIDNGPGIPEDKLPKIFEPLFTTKSFGVGLGLPTARQLVEQHGGTMEVVSKIGEGTTFTIRLPSSAALPQVQAA